MKPILAFLLVPDSSASSRVRRLLAEQGGCTGIVVGTWSELIEQASNAYLLPPAAGDWQAQFYPLLEQMKDAFWAESLSVAFEETAAAIEDAVSLLVAATQPDCGIGLADLEPLAERPRHYLQDIVRLVTALDGCLPGNLSVIRKLLAVDVKQALRSVCVYRVAGVVPLTCWQVALIDKLNRDAGTTGDEQLRALLETALSGAGSAVKPQGLVTLQSGLFSPPDKKTALDDSVQWLGVRDFLEEAEIAAGMVQRLLAAQVDLSASDIGLLLPDSFEYALVVADAFSRAGLAVSGLPVDHWQRDLGREALFHFLYCRQKPAPAMALAVCLASPLMPWCREDGAGLAQRVMDGDYRLKPFIGASRQACQMLDLLREGDDQPAALMAAINAFVALLEGGDAYAVHDHQATIAAQSLCALLGGGEDIDWVALRRAATPKNISTGAAADFNLQGVTLWREGHEPWRNVRHLLVLGFAAGHYPVVPGTSPVFVEDDLISIRQHTGWLVATSADALKQARARLKRQLAAVTDSVSFLVPRRDPNGAGQTPSESLIFMQQLFDAPEQIILELDCAEDHAKVRYLASVAASPAQPPRAIIACDIEFDRDLLSLRTDAAGRSKPESPSSLETLMVSPLAWLLRCLAAEPLGWAPETADAMLLGTLAHQVFEGLFSRGCALIGNAAIKERVAPLLDEAIRQHGPFLRGAQWQVERRHMVAEITRAALVWRSIVQSLDAEILGSEEWLEGKLGGIAIHGQADVLLGLSDNRLLVVDYKRSSAKGRRLRMQKGYDSQASLYRSMLQTGGAKDRNKTELIARLKGAKQVGILYFMLNDQTALSDTPLAESGEIPGWEVIPDDVASLAIALIEKRLAEVKTGWLYLNREHDTQFLEKTAGVKPYALQNSPLIALFTLPGESGGLE